MQNFRSLRKISSYLGRCYHLACFQSETNPKNPCKKTSQQVFSCPAFRVRFDKKYVLKQNLSSELLDPVRKKEYGWWGEIGPAEKLHVLPDGLSGKFEILSRRIFGSTKILKTFLDVHSTW